MQSLSLLIVRARKFQLEHATTRLGELWTSTDRTDDGDTQRCNRNAWNASPGHDWPSSDAGLIRLMQKTLHGRKISQLHDNEHCFSDLHLAYLLRYTASQGLHLPAAHALTLRTCLHNVRRVLGCAETQLHRHATKNKRCTILPSTRSV